MTDHRHEIPDDRELSDKERELIRWLLEHGTDEAASFVPQLSNIRVVSRCGCGCPSINFVNDRSGGMTILADYQAGEPGIGLTGVFLFACDGRLAGLDIWSIDGVANPKELPVPGNLTRLENPAT